jgi:large subunit ribosomal protein L14e
MLIEKGRVCLKIAGREAGKYCIVLEQPREGFVTIAGPKAVTGVKRRKCSIFHIEPTEHMIDVGGATDMELESGWKGSGLIEKLGIQLPEKKAAKTAKERPRDARIAKAAAPKAKPEKGKK